MSWFSQGALHRTKTKKKKEQQFDNQIENSFLPSAFLRKIKIQQTNKTVMAADEKAHLSSKRGGDSLGYFSRRMTWEKETDEISTIIAKKFPIRCTAIKKLSQRNLFHKCYNRSSHFRHHEHDISTRKLWVFFGQASTRPLKKKTSFIPSLFLLLWLLCVDAAVHRPELLWKKNTWSCLRIVLLLTWMQTRIPATNCFSFSTTFLVSINI